MGKVVPLKELRTNEEYTEAKRKIDYYSKIYAWLEQDRNPEETLKGTITKIEERLGNNVLEDDEKRKLEWEKHVLEVRKTKLQQGVLRDELKNIIMANLVLVKQYESSKETNAPDLSQGILNRALEIIGYRKKDNLVSQINSFGLISDPGDSIERQNSDSIAEYIINNCDLVIKPEFKREEQNALVKVEYPQVDISVELKQRMQDIDTEVKNMVEGIKVTSKAATIVKPRHNISRQTIPGRSVASPVDGKEEIDK